MKDLEAQVSQGEPIFSWKLETVTDKTPGMRNFLHSDEKTWIYQGKFKGIVAARDWCNRYVNKDYVRCTAHGRGKSAYVKVVKTANEYKKEKKEYDDNTNELKKIKMLVF